MPLYEIETLAHVNRAIRVDADDPDAGYEIAAASLTAQLRNAGIPADDIVLVEGNSHKDLWFAGLVCGECGSEDVTIPADGAELFCHACETSCPLPARTVEDLRRDVVKLLEARGIDAQHWHSGGGIVGIRIALASGADLFGTLEADDGEAWTGLDLSADDGDPIATLQLQVRPLGSSWGPTGTPDEFADALAALVAVLR